MKLRDRKQDVRRENRSRWKRGSFTVEAAFLIPVTVMLLALLLVYCFYRHNHVWYTAAAAEAALVGNGRLIDQTAAAAAAERAEARIRDQVMPGSAPETEITSDTSGTGVWFRNQLFPAFSELFSFETGVKIQKVRPVNYLRILWMAREAEGGSS